MDDLILYLLMSWYLGLGIAIGFIIGRKQKPWSEMTEEEKRIRKKVILSGMIILLIGVVMALWFYFRGEII